MGSADQAFCSICGAPIFYPANSKSQEWLAKCRLLTTVHKTISDIEQLDHYCPDTSMAPSTYSYQLDESTETESTREVLNLEAEALVLDSRFQLKSGEIVTPFRVHFVRGSPSATGIGGPLYIPVHEACLHIANKFIERRTQRGEEAELAGNGVSSIRNLWEVLYRRVYGSPNPSRMGYLPEPHDYYGGKLCRGLDWEPENDPESGKLLVQNPLEKLQDVTDHELLDILKTTEPTKYDGILSIRNGKRIWRILSEARVGDVAEAVIAQKLARRAEKDREAAEAVAELQKSARYWIDGMPPGANPPSEVITKK